MIVSERIAGVEYAIRDIIWYAREYERSGKDIIYLNIGDPVKYGFKTPLHIKQALIDAVLSNENYYADSEGLIDLRKAIIEKESAKGLSLTEDDVIVTNGVSEGLDMIMASIIDPNSEVLMSGPYYPPYSSYAKFYGGKPIEFDIYDDGRPDIDDIKRKISNKTRAICIINPNNPTGEVFDENSLKEIINVAAENNLYIICDEIYDKIVFDEKFTGIGKVSSDSPIILLNGFSKAYLMTGWRCGYICINGNSRKMAHLKDNVPKLARVRIATNLPVQYAAIQALKGPQKHIDTMVKELKDRRDFVVKRLNEIEGLSCRLPHGSFYAFPKLHLNNQDDKKFVIDLLNNTGVLTVHGSGFGVHGRGHFRIVFLPDLSILDEAMTKIEKYVKSIRV